jgi:hypothetical protein
MEVTFEPKEHKYHNRAGVQYISATQLVERFCNPFDTHGQSMRMAHRWGQTPEYWKEKWKAKNDQSLVRGDELHKVKENFMLQAGYTYMKETRHIVHHYSNMNKVAIGALPDGTYPELLVYRHDWKLAGRIDKPTLETVNGVRYAHIEDFKSNEEIDSEGFNPEDMMKVPLQHLKDCNLTHYTLQLSIYQFILEWHGYKPGIRRIIHYPHAIPGIPGVPTERFIEVPYLREEVLMMVNNKQLYQ